MSLGSLLVLLVPRRHCDDVVDALMEFTAVSGFTVVSAAGFSRAHSQFNRRERVQGYGDYDRFEVLCDEQTRQELLKTLVAFAGRDHFRYWVLPLDECGVIGA